jgi:O-antigen/teichoic acid export membrane protein
VLRLLIPLAALTAAASPFLLRLLAGPTFQLHPMLPVWAAVSEMFHLLSNLFYLGGIARRQTREMVLPVIPGVILVLLAVYPASASFGLHGAGAAVTASYLILDVSMWIAVQRHIFSKVTIRDLVVPSLFALAIVVFCIIAGLAGWQASVPKAALTVVIAGLLFAGGALAGLPRLLTLTQPPAAEEAPIEASRIEEAPCL